MSGNQLTEQPAQKQPAGRHIGLRVELLLQFLIVLSMIAFALETLPGLTDEQHRWLYLFELFSVVVFSAEYVFRLFIAKPPLKYALSFFGLVDLLSVAPFYLSLGMDLRSLRALRLLRLFRILKLVRYSAAMRRFHRAFVIAREELVLFGVTAVILIYLSAVGMYYCEHEAQPEKYTSIFDSLWWALATLTTVGYGDIYPITPGGRFLTFFILMLGLGVIAVPTGLVASALAAARKEEEIERSPPAN